ncbi:MAG: lipoyl synthase [Actinomycetota bacterium]|nr:lipoyl synthase [Actinomycetota bacterium]
MLAIRWLGRVRYREALDLQRQLQRGDADHLLLLEHDHVFTGGPNADPANLLVDPTDVGATFERVDRGGDITYHGPGQLTGYPVLTVAGRRGGGLVDTVAYVRQIEQVLIDALADVGLPGCGRVDRYPGVWVDPAGSPRKIAAIGVRLSRGRSMHGFAVNVAPDLQWFERIVPCGIADLGVTSLANEGVEVSMRDMVDAVVDHAGSAWGADGVDRRDVVWRHRDADLSAFSRGLGPGEPDAAPRSSGHTATGLTIGRRSERDTTARRRGRLDEAGVDEGLGIAERKPSWMKARIDLNEGYRDLKRTMRELDLVTVCEEAGCPNIYECWGAGTATFMINGERCTRACGFCLVDTRYPEPLDPGEPQRVAEAVGRMALQHVVITAVARDDLVDGCADAFAATIAAVSDISPETTVEVLVPDFGGEPGPLQTVVDASPYIVNHNIETVARLQRAVRPSAGYARSLTVLARSAAAGVATKSGIIVGMGESDDEVDATLADLAAIGTEIVTIGQYLRPTTNHVPVHRWVEPETFDRWKAVGEELGIGHVESSPLTRSSYHAGRAAAGLH